MTASRARYVIGIDLGTTHCAAAYAPLPDERNPDPLGTEPEVLLIPQLVARGVIEARPLLPSFLYLAHESEGAEALPWDATRPFAVGEYARTRAAEAPGRVVASAKSWLSHPTVNRRAPILPAGAAEGIEKISPVEASWRYLEHITEAWDHTMATSDPSARFVDQEVVLTVPASFDPAARELTVEAATAAGIEHLTLLEEPQAALYAYLAAAGDRFRTELSPGDLILVVDIGGGTTDFSAIAVVDREGSLELERVAVGDHILLGGDNMDLALAHVAREKLRAAGKEIDRWQMAGLTHAARIAKERLLGDPRISAAPIALAGRGAQLFGGSLRTELSRDEIARTLVEGFFPVVPASARPAARPRGALTQIGLPYAADPGVTRHLAAFLGRQAAAAQTETAAARAGAVAAGQGSALAGPEPRATAAGPALGCRPTTVLFNGGVMKGESLRERLLATLNGWLAEDGAPPVRQLRSADLDLAVARGAAVYGLARRGRGIRIRGGTARAYYVGIESPMPAVPGFEPPLSALCVAPFGMEEGSSAELPPHELGVVVGEPVRFRFFGSSVRRNDTVGTVLETDAVPPDELTELSPIEVTLPAEGRRAGDVVPVRLSAAVTEVGTLRLEAIPEGPLAPGERWQVELSVRNSSAEAQGAEEQHT